MSDPLAQWPTDLDAAGDPVPPPGSVVAARRISDDRALIGVVEDNRAGVFLKCDGEEFGHVLTASLWEFAVLSPAPSPSGGSTKEETT